MMKELYENWRRFLTEDEEEKKPANYLATPQAQPSLKIQKDPKKDPINNPSSDSHGTFVHIMSDKIENQLKALENAPEETLITIDLASYLDALYPPNLFPGGWKKVWADAQNIRKNKQYGVGGKLYWRPNKPLKIQKSAKLAGETNFGKYIPKTDTMVINFPNIRKQGKDPLQVIVHELGHCINDGPSETRMDSESQSEVAGARGYKLGKGYRKANIQAGKTNIYDELSNIGQIILRDFIREKKEIYNKIKDLTMANGNNQFRYVLSRSESQQRYYRPMKFWFAKILQRIKKEGNIQRGEIPNLGDPNYYVILQSYATPKEYEDLAYQIEQATKGTPVPQVRDYIVERIRACKEDSRSEECLMNKRGIYPEIVSTVKAEPQEPTSQVA